MKPEERIIVALDVDSREDALVLAEKLQGHVGAFKIGKELFTAQGPDMVRDIIQAGNKVFLDLKYHDIPNTVFKASAAASLLGVYMFNVHASGGSAMMEAAVSAARASDTSPLVLAVTVLTSIDEQTLRNELRVHFSPLEQVRFLSKRALECGMDGVVCSPREIEAVREECGSDFVIVTPGIRPEWARSDDQKRIMTPREALKAGADYMVIGRPITRNANPREAAMRIAEELYE